MAFVDNLERNHLVPPVVIKGERRYERKTSRQTGRVYYRWSKPAADKVSEPNTIRIHPHLWKKLEAYWQFMKQSHRSRPFCALLGERDGVIQSMIKTPSGSGGCWNMPDIKAEGFAFAMETLGARGCALTGMVRIGAFQVGEQGPVRGPALEEIAREAPKFFMLSLGLEGGRVETFDTKSLKYVDHSYVVIGEEEAQKLASSKTDETSESEGSEDHGKADCGEDGEPSGGEADGCDHPEPGVGRAVPAPDQGDVPQAGGAGSAHPADERGEPGRVPEPEGRELRQLDQGQPAGSGVGVHPPGRGHHIEDNQSHRGLGQNTPPAPELNEAEKMLWGMIDGK